MKGAFLALVALGTVLGGGAAVGASEADEPVVPLYDNLGTWHHPITTRSELAQRYFDQGLRLGYAFWWSEARRSFEEAIRQDPDAPMAWWGKAWAYGPYLNNGSPPKRQLETAYEAIETARRLAAARGTDKERAYIEALAARYAEDPATDRAELDRAYWLAMRRLAEAYPDDLDAVTLAAAAYMNTTRWDYWTRDGKPKPGTEELVALLESVLARTDEHPGAHHYYIHAVEASDRPERAVRSAELLPATMPGAAHLVHMGSHILIQVGRYDDAADTNIDATSVDEMYIGRPDQEGIYPLGSYYHNIHFIWSAATFEGRSAVAIQQAKKCRERVYATSRPKDIAASAMRQLYASLPVFALVRFGRWDELLRESRPPEEYVFATGLWHYGRGVALAALGRFDEAGAELERLEAIAAREDLPGMGRLSSGQMLRLAARTLAGETALRQGRLDEAIELLEEAVTIQDNLAYTEPPPWHYPVRQSLGWALLEAGRPSEAEAVYRADLARWRENGWSLYGLLAALRAQGKVREAVAVEKRFLKAWVRADVALTASRF